MIWYDIFPISNMKPSVRSLVWDNYIFCVIFPFNISQFTWCSINILKILATWIFSCYFHQCFFHTLEQFPIQYLLISIFLYTCKYILVSHFLLHNICIYGFHNFFFNSSLCCSLLCISFWKYIVQAGTELCQAQLKLASSLFWFRLKVNSGSLLSDLKNMVEITI